MSTTMIPLNCVHVFDVTAYRAWQARQATLAKSAASKPQGYKTDSFRVLKSMRSMFPNITPCRTMQGLLREMKGPQVEAPVPAKEESSAPVIPTLSRGSFTLPVRNGVLRLNPAVVRPVQMGKFKVRTTLTPKLDENDRLVQ